MTLVGIGVMTIFGFLAISPPERTRTIGEAIVDGMAVSFAILGVVVLILFYEYGGCYKT